jgi:hypothetical protein
LSSPNLSRKQESSVLLWSIFGSTGGPHDGRDDELEGSERSGSGSMGISAASPALLGRAPSPTSRSEPCGQPTSTREMRRSATQTTLTPGLEARCTSAPRPPRRRGAYLIPARTTAPSGAPHSSRGQARQDIGTSPKARRSLASSPP